MPTLSKSVSQVVALLDTYPQIRQALVFGSLLDRPEQARDVDIGFVSDKPGSNTVLNRLRPLLYVGSRHSGHYAMLDVFAVFHDAVFVRDDECAAFTRAKKAAQLRAAITKAGVPWSQWRVGVELHPDVPVPPVLPAYVYFAHPMNSYDTPLETRASNALMHAGFEVCNPNKPDNIAACGKDMTKWAALAQSCDGVAVLAFEGGAMGAGVAMEADAAKAQGKPIYVIDRETCAIYPCPNWPQGFRILSVEETRAALRSGIVPAVPAAMPTARSARP